MKRPRYQLRSVEDFKAKDNGSGPQTDPGVVLAVRKELAGEVAEGADGKLDFTLSSALVDRSGDVVNQQGWHLENYSRNPVVLWAHDQSAPPVAKSPRPVIEDGKLKARGVEFTSKDLYPFGAMVGEMYRQKFLSAVSVGFLPRKWAWNEERGQMAMDFLEQELLEFSAVPVPANPEALVGAKAAGIDVAPMVEWAEKVLEGEGKSLLIPREHVEAIWKASKPNRTISLPAATRSIEDMEDEGEDAIVAALDANTAAILENAAETRALREMLSKAAPAQVQRAVPSSRALSAEDIAKQVAEQVRHQLAALTGRND